MNICMCDVGDGLNLFIDRRMMVDFGGEKEKLKEHYRHRCCHYCYPFHHIETFVLSHFHEDHYNGLFLEDEFPHYYFHDLKYVYYQGIPIIVDEQGNNIHTKFLSYLMAMNHYMLGDKSGVASADLIDRLQQLSHSTFAYAPLFKGDTFTHNTRKYEVLWPPRRIEENKIFAKIKKAINDFEKAKKNNPELDKLAEKYKDIAEKYARNGEATAERRYEYPNESMQKVEQNRESNNETVENKKVNKKDLPEFVQAANKSLRDAANDLSLAFKSIDNDLLFMGDVRTYKSQTNTIYDVLKGQTFKVFVTPHHGTYADEKMQLINAKIALSSVGSRKLYNGYLKNEYLKAVSNHLYCTKKDGCLVVDINYSSLNIDMCKHDFEEISWK
ncbi:MAG: hypothetical protein PHX13_11815 [Thiovulaceae bacterium]|nr:hypothetical protein [Sulfurimonadaceae bacterium]